MQLAACNGSGPEWLRHASIQMPGGKEVQEHIIRQGLKQWLPHVQTACMVQPAHFQCCRGVTFAQKLDTPAGRGLGHLLGHEGHPLLRKACRGELTYGGLMIGNTLQSAVRACGYGQLTEGETHNHMVRLLWQAISFFVADTGHQAGSTICC